MSTRLKSLLSKRQSESEALKEKLDKLELPIQADKLLRAIDKRNRRNERNLREANAKKASV